MKIKSTTKKTIKRSKKIDAIQDDNLIEIKKEQTNTDSDVVFESTGNKIQDVINYIRKYKNIHKKYPSGSFKLEKSNKNNKLEKVDKGNIHIL